MGDNMVNTVGKFLSNLEKKVSADSYSFFVSNLLEILDYMDTERCSVFAGKIRKIVDIELLKAKRLTLERWHKILDDVIDGNVEMGGNNPSELVYGYCQFCVYALKRAINLGGLRCENCPLYPNNICSIASVKSCDFDEKPLYWRICSALAASDYVKAEPLVRQMIKVIESVEVNNDSDC